jgi:DNA mismatch repair ATPase MutS
MKAHLLFPDRDLDVHSARPNHADTLLRDLGLDTIVAVMADGGGLIADVSTRVLTEGLCGPAEVVYRQAVLRDCIAHPEVPRQLYDVVDGAIAAEQKEWHLMDSPDLRLSRGIRVMEIFVHAMNELRALAEEHASACASDGFSALFRTFQADLDDAYLAEVGEHLSRLRFRQGVLLSTGLGRGLKASGYVVRGQHPRKRTWWERLGVSRTTPLTVVIPDRDEAGARALGDIRARGINVVSNALAQSTDHILAFFSLLRSELAFYLGCLNLHRRLTEVGLPVCFPTVTASHELALEVRHLYDPGLALRAGHDVVGNELDASGQRLIIITGANQGGKSTFLRALGLAQILLAAGVFVPAKTMTASLRVPVLTHFKREEDETLQSGKFEEELARMSGLIDEASQQALVLMNESFAATNESEGAEIGSAVIRGLIDSGAIVVVVTHSYELATRFANGRDGVLFLRAERGEPGRRPYRLPPGLPLPTAFGKDLFGFVFGERDGVPPSDG